MDGFRIMIKPRWRETPVDLACSKRIDHLRVFDVTVYDLAGRTRGSRVCDSREEAELASFLLMEAIESGDPEYSLWLPEGSSGIPVTFADLERIARQADPPHLGELRIVGDQVLGDEDRLVGMRVPE